MTATQSRPVLEALLPPAGRKRRRIALAAVIVVVLAVFGTWLVAYSPVFGVGTVEVHGVRTIAASTVEQAGDIKYGQPTVRVDTDAIAARVERLPQVASARVTTSFPSTVRIQVTERVPVGYVMVAGRRELVDRTGKQYLGVDKAAKLPALPHLVVPSGHGQLATGGAVATVARSLPAALRAKTTSIQALDPEAITLVLRGKGDGTVLVQWGDASRSADKAVVTAALRGRKNVDRIDVSDPDRPFTS